MIRRIDLVQDTTLVDVRYRLIDLDTPRPPSGPLDPFEPVGLGGPGARR
jgi:hypothetical protein